MRTPASTYRLQVRASFDLDAAAALTGYLHALGADWVYLSPLLQATAGSDHGYDVVDPSQVDESRGGPEALARFSAAARATGLGILVDIVPNHMGISQPEQNPWWWDVLRLGRGSRYAEAFDIDWDAAGGRVRVPILSGSLEDALGELILDAEAGVVRYADHVLPLAPGSADDGADLTTVLPRQHWDLVHWRREASDLNYRRFFAVSTLAGLRVEVPWVFAESHAEVARWMREGLVDGLRVDHPDGLADPGDYLERLSQATGGSYALVEKILERSATADPERLPAWWATEGTTGYDAMAEIDRVLVDPAGERSLDDLDARLRAETAQAPAQSWHDLIHDTKRMISDTIQVSEIRRLVRCLPDGIRNGVPDAQDALAELLACFPVYRSYLPAGRGWLKEAASEASRRRPDLAGTIRTLLPALSDRDLEVARRFQQTTGPVMAKGVEDTAFYRATRLGTLTEVGGDPSVFALTVEDFHAAFARRQAAWPHTMTALSTHDTKRGEDVRARLSVLAELPERWATVLEELRSVASSGHGPFDSLLWQAIVGSWPATPERLHAYAEKAAREAGESTTWWDPVEAFERRMHGLVDAAFGAARGIVEAFAAEIAPLGWSNSLAAKALQLTGPGVPDVYQGSELWETSLVDPDNRRSVDFDRRRALLERLDAGWQPPIDETGAAKLLVVSRALRQRRDRPDLFTRYTPMTVVGAAADHAIAFDRGGALTVATRLPAGLDGRGGWGETVLLRHAGATVDAFTGRRFTGSEVRLADVLSVYPVALLVPGEDG
ncbi:MAG TPA: malto-oligosyltrehalose synthase [Microbacterium sp.]|nr:malto-oligosyltrehalose synthase [Microbacterium sp.]